MGNLKGISDLSISGMEAKCKKSKIAQQ